jgi:uncharacterized damage-inducible protein DinB
MVHARWNFLAVLGLIFVFAAPGVSQPAQAQPITFPGQVVANLEWTAGNLIKLAEAIPAEKYSWRPAPGVRSVSEVFMHVTMANYFLLSHIGVQRPADLPADAEKSVTEKEQVVAWLKKSVDAVLVTVRGIPEADLTKPVRLFNSDNNVQGVLLQIVSHVHEHLGQTIAYARSIGVKPPWSR